jgi:hypothetical protein
MPVRQPGLLAWPDGFLRPEPDAALNEGLPAQRQL